MQTLAIDQHSNNLLPGKNLLNRRYPDSIKFNFPRSNVVNHLLQWLNRYHCCCWLMVPTAIWAACSLTSLLPSQSQCLTDQNRIAWPITVNLSRRYCPSITLQEEVKPPPCEPFQRGTSLSSHDIIKRLANTYVQSYMPSGSLLIIEMLHTRLPHWR